MRLIDADALIEEIKSLQVFVTGLRAGKGILNEYAKQYRESLLRIVDEQPTAYDISKVIAELDELMVKTTSKMVESKEVPEWFYEVKTGEYISKKDTIIIVRKGGIE